MATNRRIRAVVFDLGGVVVDIDPPEITRRWARAVGARPEQVHARFAADRRHYALERGEISIHQYHEHVMGLLGRDLPFEQFLEGWNGIFRGLLPGIEGLLERLAGQVRLVAVTNTNAAHTARWRALYGRVLRHFERIFLSHEMGTRKPEPECFRQVLAYLEIPPGQVVFVDDAPENVAAAEALGMVGIVATDPPAVERRLGELGVVEGPAPRRSGYGSGS